MSEALDPVDARRAFFLVCGAGLATGVGAAVVFCDKFSWIYNSSFLAGSLAFSGGVMLYVSFVEIFSKSLGSFTESGISEERAYLNATLCFFGGVLFMQVLDYLVHRLQDTNIELRKLSDHNHNNSESQNEDEMINGINTRKAVELTMSSASNKNQVTLDGLSDNQSNTEKNDIEDQMDISVGNNLSPQLMSNNENSNDINEIEKKKLIKMGLVTALAIGLHNFPEGLATFVGTLADVKIGLGLAVAIGIHNIPEGLCVAIPIYYATRNRCYAFSIALFSGISELIGAGLGWIVLYNRMSDTLYATIFGIVGGMMVSIVLNEILPTAYRYDPDGLITKMCLNAGMIVMAFSLVLFALV